MDYGRGRKTHRPRAIPAWRVKTDFNGGAVNDAASEHKYLLLELKVQMNPPNSMDS